ncbi:MAG TPA: four helix bundle protein [Flavobacteriales bacterium]|jgi:four helix bundle protein|nr:four helix bundle protein [Flavobacteriales bacterium]
MPEQMEPRKFDLQDRLDMFAARIVNYVDRMPKTMSGKYYGGQLLRSGGSPALHYGEASGAESTNDFVHKLRIALKELKESRSNLKIQGLSRLMLTTDVDHQWLTKECGELIAILAKSIDTARKNQRGMGS